MLNQIYVNAVIFGPFVIVSLHLHRFAVASTGCLKYQAEIIPAEPGPGNAG